MENNESFKPEINLQEFSVVAVAIKYWESPTIRKKIRQCIREDDFNDVLLKVLRRVKGTCLPPSIEIKIQDVIPFIGRKIYHWLGYVTSDLNLGLQYTKKMYWTNYGTIDEAKTFQLYWQNDSNLLSEQGIGLPALYSIACINCQEQFVSDNLDHMRETLQNYCGSSLNIPEDVSAHSLISTWICYYIKEGKKKMVVQSNCSEATLFSTCVIWGFLNGVRYFGNRLKSGRDGLFYRLAETTLKQCSTSMRIRYSDKKDYFIEIIIYLIQKMIPETRSLFLCKNLINLFEILIEVWPHNKSFLLKILNYSLPDIQAPDQKNLLISVLEWNRKLTTSRAPIYFTKRIILDILRIILTLIPVELKNKIIIDEAGQFFKNLIYQADFQTIEVILDDPDVKAHRHEIVTRNIVEAFRHNLTETAFDSLQKFTDECLTDDEKHKFKSNLNNFQEEILAMGEFDLSVRLINWVAQSEEEKAILKRGINTGQVFLHAKSNKKLFIFLSIAQKLLNWQFDRNVEQIRSFKRTMRSEQGMTDDFIRTQFYDIWNRILPTLSWGDNSSAESLSGSIAEGMCSLFLNFIFDSDEAEIFKKEKIIGDENFIRSLTLKELRRLNDLLRFCGLTAAEVVELKRKIFKDVDSLVLYFAVEKSQFAMAIDLLNWLAADEEEKKDIIRNFLNSEKGVDLCCELLSPASRMSLESTLFLNSWVKAHGNTSKLLSGMTGRFKTAELSKVKELFRKLEECDYLICSELS